MESISLIGAFIGGFASFLSPCTLPLLPSLIAFFEEGGEEKKQGRMNLGKLAAFWAGFILVFLAMGSIASTLGILFYEHKEILLKIGGGFIMLMGALLLGLGSRSFINHEYRPFLNRKFRGCWGAFFFGIAFTVGWQPCSGPILATVLTVAGSSENPTGGMLLLASYAVGFGVPFFILTFFFDRLIHKVKNIYLYLPLIQKTTGIILIFIGFAIFTNRLSPWLVQVLY